ncbi:MAG: phosphoribosylamine--glycine ligase [Deltaproteobacteria bacterium]|nr:phosphoribosylamine--glycine ligase [Deltaproteobacteria bacterium]
MRILVVGNGGREHALVWKIHQSPHVQEIFCAPGNAGIASLATCIPVEVHDIQGLCAFAKAHSIDLTVVGPELPLSLGIVDEFQKQGLKIFGPSKQAAQFESSKIFSKKFMKRYGIPTADFMAFEKTSQALLFLDQTKAPWVIKADGLASGKGVRVCKTKEEAQNAVHEMMEDKAFGQSGLKIIIEDFLEGEELSYIALVDGKTYLPLASSQDHKALQDGDRGPNTGGMGAYSPAPLLTKELERRIQKEVLDPFLHGLKAQNMEYKGVLYVGVMVVNGNPYVLEFNVRLGDPETQPLMMRLQSDIIELFRATLNSQLEQSHLRWSDQSALCVVLASSGYPGGYEKGKSIVGLESVAHQVVFHGGTKKGENGVLTNGGRVLSVGALGKTLQEAYHNAYEGVSKISWDGVYYRKDIGAKALS